MTKPTHIYIFDHNRRIYEDLTSFEKSQGRLYSNREIWRGHWRKLAVTGETSRSWLLQRGRETIRVPKRGHDQRNFAFSVDEIRLQEYREKWYLVEAALKKQPVEALKQIADMIGFEMPEPVWPARTPDDERI